MLTLEQMTPEQKLGRVLCARRFTEEDTAFVLELIKKEACGAIQMPFNRASELIPLFRELADYPLLIMNDMENGYPPSVLPKIPVVTLAAAANPAYTRAFAAAIAAEAKAAGYNGCWGPVVDILAVNGPVSVARKAGDNPDAVLEVAREILSVFASYHFFGSAKHYPGGQDSPDDTHMVEGVCSADEERLLAWDLAPYIALMKEDILPSIMVGHQVCPKVDELPASLSKKVVDIFRNEGFDGVAFTDSLAMMGILQKYGEAGAMSMALMAGNDIILPNYRTPVKEVYDMMLSAYREGRISDERLDEAVRRVMTLERYCAEEAKNPVPVPENIAEVLDAIVRDSITAECDEGVSPFIDPEKPRLFIVVTPNDYKQDEVEAEIAISGWYDPTRVIAAIHENFPTAEVVTVPEFPGSCENELTLNAATRYDEVVFVSYCMTTAYLGTDHLTRRTEALINALSVPKKIKALVHFGNPLALENVTGVARKLLGYTAPAAQRYAFEVLAGKIPALGKNPFPRLTKQYRK